MAYEIVKIIHLVAVISWMAGLFYLPRLFVYHVEESSQYNAEKLFQKMEHKLFTIIMMPAFVVTYLSGFYLAIIGDFLLDKWFILKLFTVFLLTAYHYVLRFCKKKLIHSIGFRSGRFFRILNEVPTVLLIIIITLVILKPFL